MSFRLNVFLLFFLQIQDFRFLCPNRTAFDQEAQICADWGDVDCEAATLYYGSDNFDLYRIGSNFESKKSSFVEDDDVFHLQRAETSLHTILISFLYLNLQCSYLMTFSICIFLLLSFSHAPDDARRSKQYIVNQNKQNLIQSPTRPPTTTTTTIRSLPPSTIITTSTTLRPTYEHTTRRLITSTVLSTPQPFRAPAPQAFAKIVAQPKSTTTKTTAPPKEKFSGDYVISTYRPSHNFLNHARASSSNNGE